MDVALSLFSSGPYPSMCRGLSTSSARAAALSVQLGVYAAHRESRMAGTRDTRRAVRHSCMACMGGGQAGRQAGRQAGGEGTW